MWKLNIIDTYSNYTNIFSPRTKSINYMDLDFYIIIALKCSHSDCTSVALASRYLQVITVEQMDKNRPVFLINHVWIVYYQYVYIVTNTKTSSTMDALLLRPDVDRTRSMANSKHQVPSD